VIRHFRRTILFHGLNSVVKVARLSYWLLVAMGLSIMAYQTYTFLNVGHGHAISLMNALLKYHNYLGPVGEWARDSSSWIGLRRAMRFLPVSIFLVLCGFAIDILSQGKFREYVLSLKNKSNSEV